MLLFKWFTVHMLRSPTYTVDDIRVFMERKRTITEKSVTSRRLPNQTQYVKQNVHSLFHLILSKAHV